MWLPIQTVCLVTKYIIINNIIVFCEQNTLVDREFLKQMLNAYKVCTQETIREWSYHSGGYLESCPITEDRTLHEISRSFLYKLPNLQHLQTKEDLSSSLHGWSHFLHQWFGKEAQLMYMGNWEPWKGVVHVWLSKHVCCVYPIPNHSLYDNFFFPPRPLLVLPHTLTYSRTLIPSCSCNFSMWLCFHTLWQRYL
jgi:hypothetical protein